MGLENDAEFYRWLQDGIRENLATKAYYKELLEANLQKLDDVGKYHKEVISPAHDIGGPLLVWDKIPDDSPVKAEIKEKLSHLTQRAKQGDKIAQLILERTRFFLQTADVHPPVDIPSLDWIDADAEQRPLDLKVLPESNSRETEIAMATKLVRNFVMETIAQGEKSPTTATIDRNNKILSALTENEGFDLGSPGAASEEVMEFARDQVTLAISQLAKITDPLEQKTNIERVREIHDVAMAYKLLKSASSQELAMLAKKINT